MEKSEVINQIKKGDIDLYNKTEFITKYLLEKGKQKASIDRLFSFMFFFEEFLFNIDKLYYRILKQLSDEFELIIILDSKTKQIIRII